jgi:hypothetical protein
MPELPSLGSIEIEEHYEQNGWCPVFQTPKDAGK